MNVLSTVGWIESVTKSVPIHEFQAGVIFAYKDLRKLVERKKIHLYKSGNFSIGNTYYAASGIPAHKMTETLRAFEVCSPVLLNTDAKPVKRCEVTYRLSSVFDRTSYESPKKYYKVCKRAFNVFKRENIYARELKKGDFQQAKNLHQEWVNYKLANYKLFKIMFPMKRYERCFESSFDHDMASRIRTVGVFESSGRMIGFRSIYVKGTEAYDLAYITDRTFKQTNFSEHFEIFTLDYFRRNFGIEYFNCGLSEGKLRDFKKHLPNLELYYYLYKQK